MAVQDYLHAKMSVVAPNMQALIGDQALAFVYQGLALVWYGAAWCDVDAIAVALVRCGMLWYGMVWYDVAIAIAIAPQ